MNVKRIKIEDYDYSLPDGRIALHPLEQRDSCKLIVSGQPGKISHYLFSDLPLLLKPDTLIVANETKVIRARLEFVKESGAKIEIFLLEPCYPHEYVVSFASTASCSWISLVGNKKRWKEGRLTKKIALGNRSATLSAEMGEIREDSGLEIKFSWDGGFSFAEIIEAAGNIPIPPYLKRKSEESDTDDYQTVYSHTEGSVAAPTAGLHFTPRLLEQLRRTGNEFVTLTLHVGAGTFQPVKSEEIGDHPMHTEWISVSKATIYRLIDALEQGRDILAVGTTSVRTLESLPYLGCLIAEDSKGEKEQHNVTQWMPYQEAYRQIDTLASLRRILNYLREKDLDALEATTSIMIAPGFRWRIVDRLVTNFHQPKSTLLLLVASFLGDDADGKADSRWRRIYEEALEKEYRFLSYGDACLFTRKRGAVELPLSKSIMLRSATIMAVKSPDAFTGNEFVPVNDDTRYFIEGLKKTVESARTGRETAIFIGDGAGPLRFLTAYAASLPGSNVRISCGEQLQRRPILPLIDTLKQLGANIEFSQTPDWILSIKGKKLSGGKIKIETGVTSQYLSALMMAAPLWKKPLETEAVSGETVSDSYVRMTGRMIGMPLPYEEPDWSAAAFFYQRVLITGEEMEIAQIVKPADSLQGDAACADIYSRLGVETVYHTDGGATLKFDSEALAIVKASEGVEFDLKAFPDLVPSLAVALCFRQIPFAIHGVGHLRHKECDRLRALHVILTRLGYRVTVDTDTLNFDGEFSPLEDFPVEIDAYGDHRMVMALYPLELKQMVLIPDKRAVSKSFPNFFAFK